MSTQADVCEPLKIYVVSKNACVFPKDDIFVPIQGGRALSQSIPGTIGDDSGDNISRFNEYYAEMSSMYWVWKNAKPSKYVGFFHHRRFLNFAEPLAPDAHWSQRNFFDFEPDTLKRFGWDAESILREIGDADLVLPSTETVLMPPMWDKTCSIYTHYRHCHPVRDINLGLSVLAERHPEDAEIASKVMEAEQGHFCHLYIMRWELFQEYMPWIFGITETMRKEMDLDAEIYSMSSGQTRALGFIGERFFNIFIEKVKARGLRTKEFERLFAVFPDEWSVKLTPRKKPPFRPIESFHKGFNFNVLGKRLTVFEQD